MTTGILVTFASRYGSTREVAETIASRLAGRGHAVRVGAVGDVRSLDGVGAVVLGTPLYLGSPSRDALDFLDRHREALGALPVALFALGPILAAEGTAPSRAQLDVALAKVPWFAPVAIEVFVGRYDPARLRLVDRLIAALPASPLHGVAAHDERDWPAIDRWAETLPGVLGASA